MRILIIEDEHYAAKRMTSLIKKELPDSKILAVLDSVEESINWFSGHVEPNLVFMDIQLADGLSFDIFKKVKVNCPIIFTSAYDEYALNAFKVNSIDYLLKPIDEPELRKAINKYQQFFPSKSTEEFNWESISKEIFRQKENYQQRFLIKTGNAFGYLLTNNIDYFMTEDGISFAFDKDGKRFIIDKSLDKIDQNLDPQKFFRISRKHIMALSSIKKIHPHLNHRLKIEINQDCKEDFMVSREKVKDFKTWIDK